MNITTQNHYKTILLELIESRLPNCRVYLFGSRAKSTHQSGSDVDLALEMPEPISSDDLLKLYSDIDDSLIPVSVDLVDVKRASPELVQEIHRNGILWKN